MRSNDELIERSCAIIVPATDARVMLNFIKGAEAKVSLVKECPREYLYSYICSTGELVVPLLPRTILIG